MTDGGLYSGTTSLSGTLNVGAGNATLTLAGANVFLQIGTGLRLSAGSVTFTPNAPDVLATMGTVSVTSPDFPDMAAGALTGLELRRTGFSIGSLTLGPVNVGFEDIFAFTGLSVTASNLAYTNRTFTANSSIQISAASAQVFPSGPVTGTATGISGSYDLATGELSLMANSATLRVLDLIDLTAVNLTFTPHAEVLATIQTTAVAIPGLTEIGNAVISNIVLRRDALTIASANLNIAEPVRGPPLIELQGLHLSIALFSVNFATGAVGGTFSISADTAILFPDIVPGGLARATEFEGIKGIQATRSGGSLSWQAGRIDANVAGLFQIKIEHPQLNLGRNASGPLFGPSNVTAKLVGFDVEATLAELQIERDGSFSVNGANLTTSGIAKSLGIAEFLPFDISELVELGDTFFAESEFSEFATYSPKNFHMVLTEAVHSPSVNGIVFEDKGKIRGYLFYQLDMSYTTKPIALMWLFYVVPEYRKSPVGRSLLDLAESHAEAQGAVAFYGGSMSGIPSIKGSLKNLYTKAGYEEMYWGRKILKGEN